MSKIDDLNTQPKYDNALQVARTASIPSNEKYTAAEWNALISKTNEVVGRANLNTWDIVTNYSELPTNPVNGQKVYVTGTGLTGHVSVQMMVNGKSSRGFYVYNAFSDIWAQKTSEGGGGAYIEIKDQFNDSFGEVDLDLITEEGTYVLKEPRDQELNDLPHYAGDGPVNVQIDVFTTDYYTIQRAIYYSITNGKPRIAYRRKDINDSEYGAWVEAKFVGVRLENLASNLSTQQQDEIKGKLGIEDYNGVTPTITASVVTDYDIDIATQTEHWNLAMTGDTDFDFTNMFASGNSKVITITLEGDFAFTFPSWLKPLATSDDYDTMGGTLAAEIVINIKNGGATPSGYYSLQMIDYAL